MTQKRYIVNDGTDSWETDELPDEDELAALYDEEPETRTSHLVVAYHDTKTGTDGYVFPHWDPKPPLCAGDGHKWADEPEYGFGGQAQGAERVYGYPCERCSAVQIVTTNVRDPSTQTILPFDVIEYRVRE